MIRLPQPVRYFSELRAPRVTLWCYLIWYAVTVIRYFDASPRLWLNSLGISGVIGTALLLSVGGGGRDSWQTFRLFLMPFCVSSFSSLTKGRDFILIFPPHPADLAAALGCCLGFLACVALLKRFPVRTAGSIAS